MIEIKDLLTKWGNVVLSGEFEKESIREAISLVVGVKIGSEDIQIKNDTIYLNIKPIYKSEIFLKKDKINAFLEKTFNKKTPRDIR